jgi:hypothetical protein
VSAAIAPKSGPMICPIVIDDWRVADRRRTSPLSTPRPTMMKAKVDAAPIAPRMSRAKNSSGSVRASAITKKPSPCSASTAT